MLAINDAKAAKTDYERYLLRHGIPRTFWKMGVEEVSFHPYKIQRQIEGSKKLSLLREVTDVQQSGYWTGLNQLVSSWSPSLGDNADNNLVVFCCEDEKMAQYCMYSLVHRMLHQTFRESQKSYKISTYRYYELWKLLQIEDPLDCPNVVVIPSLIEEGTSNQYASFKELLTSSFQIFCCTSLGPQAFFAKYRVLPGYLFYIDRISRMYAIKGAR